MPEQWRSDFMQGWQADIDTLDCFCRDDLEQQAQRARHVSRIKNKEERARAVKAIKKHLDDMLEIPEKWKRFPAFYSDFKGYISQIMEASGLVDEINETDEDVIKDKPVPAADFACKRDIETRPAVKEAGYKSNGSPSRLARLLEYYKSRGIVGEERLCILQTLCAANRICFGVEGPSGSGKTFVINALLGLLPEDAVYRIGLSSDNAIFNDAKRLNKAEFIHIPELQKAMERKRGSTVEAIKDLTEGKDAVRIVTAKKGKCSEYRIEKGKTVIYTLATENGFRKDIETRRRFVVLHTDSSPEHVEEVLAVKAQERCTPAVPDFTEEELKDLQSHLWECILPECSFKDPFSVYMARHIPNIPKSVGFVDHYYALMDAHAKFNYCSRIDWDDNIFLTLEDHYIIHELYHDDFCRNLLDICGEEDIPLVEYAKGNVDWQKCWNMGVETMRKLFPDIADEWADKQRDGNAVAVYDPIKREKALLAGDSL